MENFPSIQIESPAFVTSVLPDQFKRDWLPGSTVLSAGGKFGDIATQSIRINGISMYYITGALPRDLTLHLSCVASLLFIHVQLSGTFEMMAESLSYSFNRQDHYSVLLLTDPFINIRLPGQKEYKSIVFCYPVAFIESVLVFYPLLDELKERIKRGQNILSLDKSLSVVLSEKIYSLLHTPFTPLMEDFYARLFTEIARAAFSDYVVEEKPALPFSIHDIGCIRAAREYIDRQLLQHLTIVQISRKAGINQFKLKKGFKAIYGIGVYGYQLRQRLSIAKTALETTSKPVQQVARQAGYKEASNFSAAFKKVYGISPYRYRSNLRKP